MKDNPLTHDFSDEYVQHISELDHWGHFEAEMLEAGEEIRKIRKEESEKYLKKNGFTSSQFNSTLTLDEETELVITNKSKDFFSKAQQ